SVDAHNGNALKKSITKASIFLGLRHSETIYCPRLAEALSPYGHIARHAVAGPTQTTYPKSLRIVARLPTSNTRHGHDNHRNPSYAFPNVIVLRIISLLPAITSISFTLFFVDQFCEFGKDNLIC